MSSFNSFLSKYGIKYFMYTNIIYIYFLYFCEYQISIYPTLCHKKRMPVNQNKFAKATLSHIVSFSIDMNLTFNPMISRTRSLFARFPMLKLPWSIDIQSLYFRMIWGLYAKSNKCKMASASFDTMARSNCLSACLLLKLFITLMDCYWAVPSLDHPLALCPLFSPFFANIQWNKKSFCFILKLVKLRLSHFAYHFMTCLLPAHRPKWWAKRDQRRTVTQNKSGKSTIASATKASTWKDQSSKQEGKYLGGAKGRCEREWNMRKNWNTHGQGEKIPRHHVILEHPFECPLWHDSNESYSYASSF